MNQKRQKLGLGKKKKSSFVKFYCFFTLQCETAVKKITASVPSYTQSNFHDNWKQKTKKKETSTSLHSKLAVACDLFKSVHDGPLLSTLATLGCWVWNQACSIEHKHKPCTISTEAVWNRITLCTPPSAIQSFEPFNGHLANTLSLHTQVSTFTRVLSCLV